MDRFLNVQRGAATALDSVHIPHCDYAGDIALASNTAESLQLQQNKLYWCIPCFYECRCMSDEVLIQFVCQVNNLMVIQIKVCQRFVCIDFVDSPHNSNKDNVELDFPISLSV